mmetsp:Transcript_31011/g.90429  ORF Transcript_31011/g.90429 Transcript_31011/m.90429 type:complete len:208 (-) Transcript_31011:469-1092(-)
MFLQELLPHLDVFLLVARHLLQRVDPELASLRPLGDHAEVLVRPRPWLRAPGALIEHFQILLGHALAVDIAPYLSDDVLPLHLVQVELVEKRLKSIGDGGQGVVSDSHPHVRRHDPDRLVQEAVVGDVQCPLRDIDFVERLLDVLVADRDVDRVGSGTQNLLDQGHHGRDPFASSDDRRQIHQLVGVYPDRVHLRPAAEVNSLPRAL